VTKQCVAVVLAALVSFPSLAFAQGQKAGVVTTLEGNVTARRVAQPSGVPLKFKDDVLFQDQINTGDKSLARMLLGGKAVVTVRERSSLTITEVPGKSTIDLESGKFALAVAREKMRPGEEIQIRTPNAIAGVRGTVVVTEVVRQGAQTGGGAPAVLTNFYVLRGTITAQQLDPGTRQPTGAPLNVGTLQSYSQAGGATGRVAPVAPEQVGQITSGLAPSGPKGGGDAGQEQVKGQQMQTAVSLMNTLTGGTGDQQLVIGSSTPLTQTTSTSATSTQNSTTAPVIPTLTQDAIEVAQASAPVAVSTATGTQTLSGSFRRLSGSLTSTSTSPLVQVSGATITQSGTDPFIAIANGSATLLGGPLVSWLNSTFTGGGPFVAMEGGTFRNTSTSALLSIDPSTVSPSGNLFRLTNGSAMTLAGALLSSSDSTLRSGTTTSLASLVTILDGSTLTTTGTGALISLTNDTVDTQGPLLSVRRSASTSAKSTLSLAGPLLIATNSTINTTTTGFGATFGTANNCCSTFGVEQGGVLTSTGSGSLVTLSNTTLTAGDSNSGGNVFFLADTFTGAPSSELVASATMNLAGPLLSASGGSISALFSVLQVLRSEFKSTSTSPLISLDGTSVTLGGTDLTNTSQSTNGRLLTVSSTSSPFGTAATASTMTLSGPLLSATNSPITGNQLIGIFGGATVSSSTSAAFMTFSGSTITLNTITNGNGTNLGEVLSIGGLGGTTGSGLATLTLAGPLLSLANTTLSSTGPLVAVGFSSSSAGGQVIANDGASPFISITGGTHSIASSTSSNNALFRLFGRSTASTSETVSTPGLNTSTSTLTIGTDQPLQRTGSGAFLELSGASVSTRAGLVLDDALVSASAPLLSLKNAASMTTSTDALNLIGNAKLTTTGPFVKLDNSSLTVSSGHAVRVMGGSFLNVTGDLFSILNGGSLTVSNGSPIFVSGSSVLKVSGGLVNFNNSSGSINATNNVCVSACSTIGGIAFFLQNSATSQNISISGAIKNQGTGTINLGGLTPVIVLDGANSKVIISGN